MPNGDPTFDATAEEAWFAPISDSILSFAARHNLLVDRYYHHSRSWDLRFNHPRGGQAPISLHHLRDDTAGVGSSWHLDDYDRFTRYVYWGKTRDVPKVAGILTAELGAELAAVLALPLGSWNQVVDTYARVWGQFTKEQFQKMAPRYPDPIP
jgi:hypothetical protein